MKVKRLTLFDKLLVILIIVGVGLFSLAFHVANKITKDFNNQIDTKEIYIGEKVKLDGEQYTITRWSVIENAYELSNGTFIDEKLVIKQLK